MVRFSITDSEIPAALATARRGMQSFGAKLRWLWLLPLARNGRSIVCVTLTRCRTHSRGMQNLCNNLFPDLFPPSALLPITHCYGGEAYAENARVATDANKRGRYRLPNRFTKGLGFYPSFRYQRDSRLESAYPMICRP